jgi:carbon-monoxide dehydrogenase medium subunit
MEAARRRGDFAMMGVAVVMAVDAERRCRSARIALCNAGPTPILASKAGERVAGQVASALAIDDAARAVASEIDPPGSLHASPDFQRHLAYVLSRRALATAAGVKL